MLEAKYIVCEACGSWLVFLYALVHSGMAGDKHKRLVFSTKHVEGQRKLKILVRELVVGRQGGLEGMERRERVRTRWIRKGIDGSVNDMTERRTRIRSNG